MDGSGRPGGRKRAFGWLILVRLILCLITASFFLQHIYFEETGRILRPGETIAFLGIVYLINLILAAAASSDRHPEFLIAVSFVLDLGLLTWIVLMTGGFGSIFIPFYLPILAMASASLPPRYTAVFPSIATLGTAYVGLAHHLYSIGDDLLLQQLYPEKIARVLRYLPPHTIVATMLVLVVTFFILSYLAAKLGHRYFALRQRMAEAERTVERFAAISTMAAGLAHEIRNPLASLRSAIQEIGESFPEGSQNRLLAGIVMAESDRLDRIIGRFLDFSREGALRLSRRRLSGLLQEVRTLVLHSQDAAGLKVDLRVPDDPEVECDADRLKEVFLNLALNAAQAVPRQGGELAIRLRPAASDGGMVPGVEILFVDNGPGIGEDDLMHLFEPFFTSKENGTGMGLPLSRKQVNMHGGEIEAGNNASGRGAWFRIWLPLEQTGR